MKKLFLHSLIIILLMPVCYSQNRNTNLQWWQHARFGMFIHFGIYSIPGRGEWVKSIERISNEDYQLYADEFNPYEYNPEEWAELARSAGMKYAMMTAKHHDGFCLFDSEFTDYKSTNSPAGRDLIKEYVNAFRDKGLKVGFYYSVIDWHHPDYPKYNDPFHPMRGNEKFKDEKINWERYLEYMHGQVRELMTSYGKIDILWLDFSYGEMKGEKWKARELVAMVRKLQPEIIINNRLTGSGSDHGIDEALGDFITPEQTVPDKPLLDDNGNMIPWETCLTLNNSWGYNKSDRNWKSPELVVHTLVNCVSKGGNFLLNVGPDARGNIPDESKKILRQVGKWMEKNSACIYGCGPADDLEKPDWGRITQKGNKIYLHVMHPLIGPVKLHGYRDRIERVRFLSTGSEAPTADRWWGSPESEGYTFINMGEPIHETFQWHDPWDTVIEITLKE
jgi:alpha-L-fucosidase